jgi:Secretion system C-terminal sorting domain
MKRIITLFASLTFFSWISQAQPSTQASNINFSAPGINGFTINWTNGNGANRIVIVNSSAITFSPSASTTYVANTDFSAGTDLGSGQKCVFNGSGNSVPITGLSADTQYFVRVFEYNGAAAAELYNVTTAANNPSNRYSVANAPSIDATGLTYSLITPTTMTVSMTPGNGANRMLIAFNGAVGFVPDDGTSYTANNNFTAAANQLGNGKIVGIGAGPFNITNLTANTNYSFKVLELNGTPGTGAENYYNGGTPLTGSQSTVPNAPSTQASNITFTSPAANGFTINWTNGNGGNRIVVINSSLITFSPTAATTYTANTDFSAGTDLGSGQKCVFNGSGNSVAITGLSPNTQYFVRVFEYNGATALESYNINAAASNPNNRFSLAASPTADATSLTFSAVTTTTMTVSMTPGDGANRMLVAFNGAVGFAPADGTSYTANSNFTSAANQAGNGKIVGIGAGPFNISGLIANTNYTFKVFELNGTLGTENYYKEGTPLTGSQSTAASTPSTQASSIVFSSITPTSMTIGWNNGNGANRLVLVRENTAVSTNPSSFNSYTASSDWSTPGSQIGVGNYVVYIGSGNSVSLTNLNPSSTYHVRVFEFSGTIGSALENYNVAIASNNPRSQAILCAPPTVQATAINFGTITASTIDLNWTRGNGNNVLVLARDGVAAAVNPTDGVSYTSNPIFGSGTAIAISGNDYFTVYNGNATSVTVQNLSGSTAYNFKAFEYNTTGTCYLQTSPASNDASTSSAASTCTLTAGTGSTTISSIVNTQPAAVTAIQWVSTDIGGDNSSSRFSQLIFRPGAGNGISNFSDLILGAELYDNFSNGPSEHATAIITANSITIPTINFGGSASASNGDLGTIPEGTSKTYTLRVWLKPTLGGSLPITVDGLKLVLSLTDVDITIVPGKTGYAPGATTNSGGANNVVTVLGTQLAFTQQPSTTANATIPLATQPILQATDVNGNRDLGFNNSVASVNTSPNLSPAYTAFNFINGVATFTDLQFNAVGTSAMTVTANSITSAASASPITVNASTAISGTGLLGIAIGPNLTNSTTNQAVFGFSLTTTGSTLNFTDVSITTTSDPDIAFKATSIRLVKSTDNDFSTAGNNTVVSSTYTTPGNSIDFSPFASSINGSPSYFFIVADIEDSFSTLNPTIQLSIASTGDFAVSTGGKTGTTPINGVNYTLKDFTPPSVTAITIVPPPTTNSWSTTNGTSAPTVTFRVTFNEDVTGITYSGPNKNFQVQTSGSVSAGNPAGVGATTSKFVDITRAISGQGRLRYDFIDNDNIFDIAGNPIGGAGAGNGDFNTTFSGNQYYSIVLPEPFIDASFAVTAPPVTVTSNSITLQWTPNNTAQTPTHYLVLASTGAPVPPIDGITATPGALTQIVPFGTNSAIFNNLSSGTIYNFAVYKYTLSSNNTPDNIDFELTEPALLNGVLTPTASFSSINLNSTPIPISSLKTTSLNSEVVMQFTVFDDGQDPILPNVMTLQLNGVGSEKIVFRLRDQLTLAEGASLTGFTTSTGSLASAIYTGKGTTNTITLTSASDGDWNVTTTVDYTSTGNAIFSTPALGRMQSIDSHPVSVAADQIVTFNSNGIFVVPAGVTNITVETWGGGGAGGAGVGGSFWDAGGGGGGGGYSRSLLSVTPGSSFGVTVGAGGPTSSASGAASNFGGGLVVALGGLGGGQNTGFSAGSGGVGAGIGTGQVAFAGGFGRQGSFGSSTPASAGFGGGGGSSAGNTGNGNTASTSAGASAPVGGGNGGNGINIGSGSFGFIPGGGGGGSGNGVGGDGANGRVRITYSDPTPLTGPSDWDADNAPFKFSGLVIRPGAGNNIADWKQIIEGVELSDNLGNFVRGVDTDPNIEINATDIKFLSIPSLSSHLTEVGFITDANGVPSSKTYTLKIWLKPNLNSTTIDGQNLAFRVEPTDIAYNDGSGQSSRLVITQPTLQSGANEIEVVATKLDFTTNPNPTQLVLTTITSPSAPPDLSTTPVIRARDIHGNTDKDYGASITVAGATAATLPATVTMSNGKATLAGVQYQNAGNGTLTATTSTTAANSLIPALGTSTAVGVTYSNTTTITAGLFTEPSTFSSLNTASFVRVFDFNIVDDNGSGGDGSPTRISQLVITPGTGNNIGNWLDAISQVEIRSGFSSVSGTVNATNLTFSGINPNGLGFIADNLAKNYSLFITLKPALGGTLPNDIDNRNFVFEILDVPSSITLDPLSSNFTGSETENSGLSNIAVEVIATKLQFDTNPAAVLLLGKDISLQPPVPVVEALDVNNNRDINYNSTTVTVTNSLGLTMAGSPGSNSIINGLLTFPNNFRFTTAGSSATLTVGSTGSSVVTNGTSTPFDVRGGNATTITAGALTEPTTISSLVDLVNTPLGLPVFDFVINDDPSGTPANENDGNPTQLNKVTITAGGGNTISNWAEAIATATLSDGANTVTVTTIDPSNYLYFDLNSAAGQALGLVTDNIFKTYTLRIWLKTALGGSLPTTIDGLRFVFDVQKANIELSANGTGFATSAQAENSNNISNDNNKVAVVATKIDFTTPVDPPGLATASASLNSPFQVVAQARDVNGNRDLGFTGPVLSNITTLTNASGATMTSTPTVVGSSFTAGVFNFPFTGSLTNDFQFTTGTNGDNVTLSMTAGGISSVAFPAPFTPEIRLISSFESSLTFNPIAPDPTIDYVNYQSNNITTANSVILETLTLTDGDADGDADGANTTLNSVTFSITNSSNINRIALYDATGLIEIAEQSVGGASSITFSGLSIAAVDTQGPTQGSTNFVIRATFNNMATDVHDLDLIQLRVTGAVLAVGSKFINDALSPTPSPSFIGGVNNGSLSPVQNIAVTATSLDFTTQASPFAGINEPIGPTYTSFPLPATAAAIVNARDKFGINDLDFNVSQTAITITSSTGENISSPASFVNGVLNLDGMVYTQTGDGKLKVVAGGIDSSNPPPFHNFAILGQTVNVVNVNASLPTSGVIQGQGSPVTFSLRGGTASQVIFGVTFTSAGATASDPKLSEFSFSFDIPYSNSSRTIFENFVVKEGTVDITSPTINGNLDFSSSTANPTDLNVITVDLSAIPRSLTGGPLTYYLIADVNANANISTPAITPKFIDGGYLSSTDKNIIVNQGTASGSFDGNVYTFASTKPPVLITAKNTANPSKTSNPFNGQLNVDAALDHIDLYFDTKVTSLDGGLNEGAELYNRATNTKVANLVSPFNVNNTPVVPGNYLSTGDYRNVVNPLRYDIQLLPGQSLQPDEVYYVLIKKGSFDPLSVPPRGTGISDQGLNFYGGISSNSTLYFKIASNKPLLLGAVKATLYNSKIGSISTKFDQFGTAYYLIVRSTDPAPTTSQVKSPGTYPNPIAAKGNYSIDQINVLQTTTFEATTPFVPLQTYNVYIYAENDANPTAIPSGGIFGSSLVANSGGPTTQVTLPSTPVTANPFYLICPNSFVTVTEPIVLSESSISSFNSLATQDFNILLPQGYEFDGTTLPKVLLVGADFNSTTATRTFISNTVLKISYKNLGNSSLDYIVLSDLRVKGASGSASQSIQRFFGNNTSFPTPIANIATIGLLNGETFTFSNSFSIDNTFPPGSPTIVNSIPDNYIDLDPNIRGGVRLIPNITVANDYNASIFDGTGVINDVLTLSAVTTNSAFNITMNHTDPNGCLSQIGQQYLVYDHTSPISTKLGTANSVINLPGTAQALLNRNFPNAAPIFKSDSVFHNEVAGYELVSLSADLPASVISGQTKQIMSGTDWAQQVKTVLNPPKAVAVPPLGTFFNYAWDYSKILNTTVGGTIQRNPFDGNNANRFDDKTSNGNLFWKGGSLGSIEYTGVFRSTADLQIFVPFRQNVELFVPAVPIIEVSSDNQSDDDPTDGSFNTKSNETAFNYIKSRYDFQYNGNYQGTSIFCESGGPITLNGFPLATAGVSKGAFAIYDFKSYDFNEALPMTGTITSKTNSSSIVGVGTSFMTELSIGALLSDASGNTIGKVLSITNDTNLTLEATALINVTLSKYSANFNKQLASAPTTFVDNGNGSMTLDPASIKNNYDDILVTYTYQENNSPAVGTGYLVIRVTPNPDEKFAISSIVAGVGASGASAFNAFCLGTQVNFDATTSVIMAPGNTDTPANSILNYEWNFGDPNSGDANTPRGTGGVALITRYIQQPENVVSQTYDKPVHFYKTSSTFTVNLSLTSNWGCSSVPSATSVTPTIQANNVLYAGSKGDILVGDIPVPKFTFKGNCVTDDIQFDASTSEMPSVGGNSAIAALQWDFDQTGFASNPPAPKLKSSNFLTTKTATAKYNVANPGFYSVRLTAITDAGGTSGCQSSVTQQLAQLPIISSATINGAFEESFNTNGGGWLALDLSGASPIPGGNSSWNYSVTNKNWATATPYNTGEKSALYSACLDLSTVQRPMISFNTNVKVNPSEGMVVQFANDANTTDNIVSATKAWTTLGDFTNNLSSGLDWYEDAGQSSIASIQGNTSGYGWTGTTGSIQPRHRLDVQGIGSNSRVLIRFALGASNSLTPITGGGINIDNVRVGSRTRTILFENFKTTDANGNANLLTDLDNDAKAIRKFNKDNINSTQVVNVNYHIGFVGKDPFNLDNPADPSSRALFYNVSKVPYAFLDGLHSPQFGNGSDLFGQWGQKAYNLQTLQLARADFSSSTISTDRKSITVKVKPKIALPDETRLFIGILETMIDNTGNSGPWTYPNGGKINTNEDTLQYILKRFVPNAVGVKFGSGTFGVSTIDTDVNLGTYDLNPTQFYSSNFSIVLFLQNEITKEVYQAELNPGKLPTDNPSDYPLPALVTAIEPLNAESINLYPNPANQEFVIELPKALGIDANIRLFDQMGKTIDGGIIPAGTNSKTIGTNGLAAGLYIVEIKTNGGEMVRKKVVIVH